MHTMYTTPLHHTTLHTTQQQLLPSPADASPRASAPLLLRAVQSSDAAPRTAAAAWPPMMSAPQLLLFAYWMCWALAGGLS